MAREGRTCAVATAGAWRKPDFDSSEGGDLVATVGFQVDLEVVVVGACIVMLRFVRRWFNGVEIVLCSF